MISIMDTAFMASKHYSKLKNLCNLSPALVREKSHLHCRRQTLRMKYRLAFGLEIIITSSSFTVRLSGINTSGRYMTSKHVYRRRGKAPMQSNWDSI